MNPSTLALAAPIGVCRDCLAIYVTTAPRPRFVWCWHSRTAARQRKDGTWAPLANVTRAELEALSSRVVKNMTRGACD